VGLGGAFYELLTGRLPFQGDNVADIVEEILSREPRRPHEIVAEINPGLEAICLRCLAKRPEDRYAARELAAELRDWLRHEDETAPLRQQIYEWRTEDRPPPSITAGDVLTGRRPKVPDLKAGCFAPRPEVYETLARKIRDWIKQPKNDSRLPVFWISGPSGAGKSVALLHVLAQLHEDDVGRIFWLENAVELLPATMGYALKQLRYGRSPRGACPPVIMVALDDPFAPGKQGDVTGAWRAAFDQLREPRNRGEAVGLRILCCGPTEQAEWLQQDRIEEVNVRREELPPPKDLKQLRRWYRQRRPGSEPPKSVDKDVLLVQLFFEWRTGEPLPEFAKRFRDRLLTADPSGRLVHLLSQVLALNQRYVDYPQAAAKKALLPSQRQMLEQLRADHHLAAVELPTLDLVDTSHKGLRLTHPHLAKIIYNSWFPPAQCAEERAEHLRAAILDCLHHGVDSAEQTSPLWSLARLAAPPGQSAAGPHLDPTSLAGLLTGLYNELHAQEAPRLDFLPAWVHVRAQVPAEYPMTPDPVEECFRLIDEDLVQGSGFLTLCRYLLRHRPTLAPPGQERSTRAQRLTEAILRVLTGHRGWASWPELARAAVFACSDAGFRELGQEWLEDRAHYGHDGWFPLWSAIRWRWSADRSLLELGLHWLDKGYLGPWRRPAWQHVWKAIWRAGQYAEQLEALGQQWLNEVHEHDGWQYLWRDLWDKGGDRVELRRVAMEWMADPRTSTHHSWLYTWEALWEEDGRPAGQEALVEVALSWLRANRNRPTPYWSILCQRLWEGLRQNEEVWELGREWLHRPAAEDRGWTFLWQAFWDRVQTDPAQADRLVVIAYQWLSGDNHLHQSWAYIWGLLWRDRRGDGKLSDLAQGWLDRVPPRHPLWTRVWRQLWEFDRQNKGVRERGIRWLKEVLPRHRPWLEVWKPLWVQLIGDSCLREVARQWLTEEPYLPNLLYVWEDLWQASPGDSELLQLGKGLVRRLTPKHELDAVPPLPRAKERRAAAETRAARPQSSDRLAMPRREMGRVVAQPAVARKLFRKNLHREQRARLDQQAWSRVWQVLWRHLPGERELIFCAQVWLRGVQTNSNMWVEIWLQLWQREPRPAGLERLTLLSLAARWIESAHPNQEYRGLVWRTLWDSGHAPAVLAQEGLRFMHMCRKRPDYFGNRYWYLIWLALWQRLVTAVPPPGAPVRSQDEKLLWNSGSAFVEQLARGKEGWAQVWLAMWQRQPRYRVLWNAARNWLPRSGDSGNWHEVWLALWEYNKGNPELLQAASAWLIDGPPQHGGWTEVWRAICPEDRERRRLYRRSEFISQLRASLLARMPFDHPHWHETWLALWEEDKGNAELLRAASRWLTEGPPQHPGWWDVWKVICPNRRLYAQREFISQLREGFLVHMPPSHPAWQYAWKAFMDEDPQDQELVGRAWEWLKGGNGAHPSWQYVWSYFWERESDRAWRGELKEAALAWLREAPPDHHSLAHVVETLNEADPNHPAVLVFCRQWIALGMYTHRHWSDLWKLVQARHLGEPDVMAAGIGWLKATVESDPLPESWGLVWQRVWKVRSEGMEPRDWRAIWEGVPQDDPRRELKELLALGMSWLNRAPIMDRFWEHVWQELWRAPRANAAYLVLDKLAIDWLDRVNPDHRYWHQAWLLLWREWPDRPALWRLGLQWLRRAQAHEGWQMVWEALWNQSPGNKWLGEVCEDWLRNGPADHRGWQYIWEQVRKERSGTNVLLAIGRDWILRRAPFGHPSWQYVWSALWKQRPRDLELIRQGKKWLAQSFDHHSWERLWQELFESSPDDGELFELGVKGLSTGRRDPAQWSFTWEHLWARNPADERLRSAAVGWLVQYPFDTPGWSVVWTKVWFLLPTPRPRSLVTRGIEYFRQLPLGNEHWFEVWQRLWAEEDCRYDHELQERAWAWVQVAQRRLGRPDVFKALWSAQFRREQTHTWVERGVRDPDSEAFRAIIRGESLPQ
jgi:hypothetical protein